MVENTEGSERTMAEVEAIKTNEDISRMENSIKKEISKLKYYLEPADELIESKDYEEMAIVIQICETLTDIISNAVELKIELNMTPRGVRQWRNDVKSSYSTLLEEREKIIEALRARDQEIKQDEEMKAIEAEKRQQERVERQQDEARARQEEIDERLRRERHEKERELFEEKLKYEMIATEKRLEMESKAKSTQAKLPKLRINFMSL
jgi:uncharacterized protein YqgV (UPF0045/DUF77 family)